MTVTTPRELSPRQREILALVAAGRTSKEIAGELGISESTVNWHISNAFDRLGASSRAEAVALAMREDIQNAETQATAEPVHTQADTSKRPERPLLPLSALALTIGLTLALGLLGGALLAGWEVTSPTWPSSSVAPSTGTPQRGEPTARPSGAGAPTNDVEAAGSDPPRAEESVPDATSVPGTRSPLPLAAPSLPTIPAAIPPLVPNLETSAPATPAIVGPLPTTSPPPAPLPTLPPAPSVPLGLP
jgi:DNA-binding CsgD family transcriptional regulator